MSYSIYDKVVGRSSAAGKHAESDVGGPVWLAVFPEIDPKGDFLGVNLTPK